MALYDTIGRGYDSHRRADPRIASRVAEALGPSNSVVNVGAGAGSYEPRDRSVVAVEPSRVMIEQRPREAAPAVMGSATALPFRDDCFDAALAILTLHHWPDAAAGLAELSRVARDRVVILTFDPCFEAFWLTDYLPEIRDLDRASMPPLDDVMESLDAQSLLEVPVPHDCTDGFLGAYWRRPEAYLDPSVRAAISVFAQMTTTEEGLARLEADLVSGDWDDRYSALRECTSLDVGYRLIIAERTTAA